MASQVSQASRRPVRQFPNAGDVQKFPLRWPGQIEIGGRKGYGICEDDDDLLEMRQAGEPWRYSLAMVPWTVTANTSIALSTTNGAVIASAFSYGQGQAFGTSAPLSTSFGTIVDTDADKDGAPIRDDEKFYIRSLGVEVLDPFVMTAGSNGTYTRSYPAWLRAQLGEYGNALKSATLNGMSLQFAYGDQACKFDLGLPSQWPQHGNQSSGNRVRNGVGFGPAQLMPLRRMFEAGPKDKTDKLTINLLGGPSLSIGNDGANAIPALSTGEALIVPVQIIAYGFPMSKTCIACDPGTTADVARAMLEELKADPGAVAALKAALQSM